MALCKQELEDLSKIRIEPGQAQAYYACQYFESIAATNLLRNGLAIGKAALDVIIAQRTYELQKANLARLEKITEQQLAQSAELHGQWAYGKACERAQLDAACNTNIPEPNYQAIYSRVASVIAAQFGNARRKIKKTYSVYCQAAACTAMRQLDIEEARTIAGAVEAAYRKAEANWKIETAAARTHLLQVLQHMRGLLASTGGLLSGATASAAAAASINPYQGIQYAGQQVFGTLTGLTYQGALAAQGAGSINGMNAFNSANLTLGKSPSDGQQENAAQQRQSLFFDDGIYNPTNPNTSSGGVGEPNSGFGDLMNTPEPGWPINN
jgi:hypothetical protein